MSFFNLIASSFVPTNTGTSFNAFSIIGSCIELVAPSKIAISSTSKSHKGILSISESLWRVFVVYVLKLRLGLKLCKKLNAFLYSPYASKINILALTGKYFDVVKMFWIILAKVQLLPDPVLPSIAKWLLKNGLTSTFIL